MIFRGHLIPRYTNSGQRRDWELEFNPWPGEVVGLCFACEGEYTAHHMLPDLYERYWIVSEPRLAKRPPDQPEGDGFCCGCSRHLTRLFLPWWEGGGMAPGPVKRIVEPQEALRIQRRRILEALGRRTS